MSLENEKNFQSFGGVKRKRIDSEGNIDCTFSFKQPNPNYNFNQLCINKIFKNIMELTYRIFKSKSESNKKDSFENRHRPADLISLEKVNRVKYASPFTINCSLCYTQNNFNSSSCSHCKRALTHHSSASLENSSKPSTSFKTINLETSSTSEKNNKDKMVGTDESLISLDEENETDDVNMVSLSDSPIDQSLLEKEDESQKEQKLNQVFRNKEFSLNSNRVYFGTCACVISNLCFSELGIKFFSVHVKLNKHDGTRFNILLPFNEISMITGSLEGKRSILIIHTIPDASYKIRTALKLDNEYLIFDSNSSDSFHRYIVMEFDEPPINVKQYIRTVFAFWDSTCSLSETSPESAYKFFYNLSKNSEKMHRLYNSNLKYEIANTSSSSSSAGPQVPIKRNKKASTIINIDLDDNHAVSSDIATDIILNYPPRDNDVITIYKQDLYCLKEGEYLNDNILGFYLKYIQREVIDSKISSQIYIFSTFFYGKLTKARKEDATKPLADKYYDRVKNWTKNVDIFEKKFLIIPMNKNFHWFLAIICYPNNVPGAYEVETIESDTSTERLNAQRACILYMDSLGAASGRYKLGEPLRHFLSKEWESKRKAEPKVFTKTVMPDYYVSVPCQTNSSDCGLFVLQYVESFLNDPDFVIQRSSSKLNNWFSLSLIHKKRKAIKDLIYQLKNEYECLSLAEGKNEAESDNKDDSKNDQMDEYQALIQSDQKQQSQGQNKEEDIEDEDLGVERKRAKTDIVNNK